MRSQVGGLLPEVPCALNPEFSPLSSTSSCRPASVSSRRPSQVSSHTLLFQHLGCMQDLGSTLLPSDLQEPRCNPGQLSGTQGASPVLGLPCRTTAPQRPWQAGRVLSHPPTPAVGLQDKCLLKLPQMGQRLLE